MGNIRDHFKKIGDIKGLFHARMGMIKDRNGEDQTVPQEINKRWQEYTELYRYLRRWVRWSGILMSKNFPQFVVIHTVKG